jgi:hypothetical protein
MAAGNRKEPREVSRAWPAGNDMKARDWLEATLAVVAILAIAALTGHYAP